MCVHGGSSRELTGEIALSEFRIVFAEVSISSETIELQKESSRETHFAATATRFELASRFSTAPGRGRFILKGARPAAPPAPRGGGAERSGLAGQGSPLEARDPDFQLFIFWKVRVAGRLHLQPVPTRVFCRRVGG